MTTAWLPNPVMVASGCGGTGPELDGYSPLEGLGGFVTRSISIQPRPGRAAPRIEEAASGWLNAIGLQNPGIDAFLATELPWLVRAGARTFVSIVGRSLVDHAELAGRLARAPGVHGVEVNLSVPDGDGVFEAREPFHAASAVAAVRRETPADLPVLAKLRSDPARVVELARAVAGSGATAVVLGNALPAVGGDGHPAGLSGPAIRPIALRCVLEVHRALPDLAVVGCGGITDTESARRFLAAGAVGVQVGSGLFADPTLAARMAADLAQSGEPT